MFFFILKQFLLTIEVKICSKYFLFILQNLIDFKYLFFFRSLWETAEKGSKCTTEHVLSPSTGNRQSTRWTPAPRAVQFGVGPRERSAVGPNRKITPKIREIGLAFLWLQQFDRFWIQVCKYGNGHDVKRLKVCLK